MTNEATATIRSGWAWLIRKYRKQLGLDQTQFAALVGTKQGVVSAWENGLYPPSALSQSRIIDKCDVSDADLAKVFRGGEAA